MTTYKSPNSSISLDHAWGGVETDKRMYILHEKKQENTRQVTAFLKYHRSEFLQASCMNAGKGM